MANLILKNNNNGETSITADNFIGNASSASKWLTSRIITIGSTGKAVNGSGNISWTLSEIGAAAKSHTHSYLPLSGGTLTGGLTLSNGVDLNLKAPTDSEDSGDIVFKNGSGTEIGRIWISGGAGLIRFNASDTSKYLIHTGNISSQSVARAAALGRDGNVSYPMTFYWSGQSGQPNWLWGGNDGTNMYIYNPSNFSVNYATSAGSASTSSTANALASTGWGYSNMSYIQTSSEWFGNSGWSHYIICNHGAGETYYNYTLALPFWSSPMYKRMTGNTDKVYGWYNFHTTENIFVQSAQPTADFVGQIWLKI